MDILQRMADTLARIKGFSVTIRASYDVVQDTGEKIESGERRSVTLSRPDGCASKPRRATGSGCW